MSITIGCARRWSLRVGLVTATAAALSLPIASSASAGQPPAGANLQQCQNGGEGAAGAAPTLEPCAGANWVTGDLNSSKAHWQEGELVPYRTVIAGLSGGPHTLHFGYRVTDQGKHAFDYLGSFDTTESTANSASAFHANQSDPCGDVVASGQMAASDCIKSQPVSSLAVPAGMAGADSPSCKATGTFSGTQLPGAFKLYGPVNSKITGMSLGTATPFGGGCVVNVNLSFSLTGGGSSNDVVIAWGAHLASAADWGTGNSASSINGAPFHMFLVSLDGGSLGSQDRSVNENSLFFVPSITTSLQGPGGVTLTSVQAESAAPVGSILPGASPSATGTVTYTLYSGGTCGGPALSTETVTVGSGAVPGSSLTPPSSGSDSYRAVYSGDGQNLSTQSSCVQFTASQPPVSSSGTPGANPPVAGVGSGGPGSNTPSARPIPSGSNHTSDPAGSQSKAILGATSIHTGKPFLGEEILGAALMVAGGSGLFLGLRRRKVRAR